MNKYFLPFALLIACESEEAVKVFNNAPTATITSHTNGEVFQDGYAVTFVAQIQDGNHENADLQVVWTTNQRTLCPTQAPSDGGISQCDTSLIEGENVVRVQVTDPEGEAIVEEIEVQVDPTFAPNVEIFSPTGTESYYSDQLVLLSARIQDNEDAPAELSYNWESSIDGLLATTAIPNEDGLLEEYLYLSEGSHALTLSVTDSSGKSTEKSLSIAVGGPNTEPTCSITAPAMNTYFLTGDTIVFEGLATDDQTSSGNLTVQWFSDKDGDLGSGTVNSSGNVILSSSALSINTHTIQFTVEDERESVCSDSVVITVGTQTAPDIVLTSPTDGDVITAGEFVLFAGTLSDNEDIPSDVSLSWVSNIDGEFSTQAATSSGVILLNTAGLSTGLHSVTVTATDTAGLTDAAVVGFRINSLPTAPSVSISPVAPITTENIVVNASGSTDADGHNVSYDYTWYQNGVLSNQTGSLLPSSATTKGDLWSVQVTPSDGYQNGPYTETSVEIQNASPTVDALSIDATQATTNQTLTCTGSASDPDGDTLTASYSWTNQTTGSVLGSSMSITLSPLSVSPGDTVSCAYSVDDGSVSANQVAMVGIVNSDPVIDSVNIVPSTPYLGDTLNCIGVVSDGDLETITESYVWENQSTGVILSTGMSLDLTSTVASPTDTIACTITGTDPSGGSAVATTTTTVGNLPPTIDSLSFSQSSLAMGETITCLSSESDPEGDIPTVTYSWTNDTQGVTIGGSASLTLSPSMATGLDEISCTVTATDNYGDSDTESISLFVEETVPEFTTTAGISPDVGVTTSSILSCSGVATDPDGGAITLSYIWTNGNTTIGSTQSISLSPTTVQPTDVVACTITATDTTGEQATSSASVMVENTPPILGPVSISPATGVDTASSLTCSAANSDADLETLTTTYTWTNGGTTLGTGATITLTPTLAQPADNVVCTASVVDGYGASASATAVVTIENTPPVIDSILLTPATAYNDSTLTCTVASSDADNQSLGTTYTWMNTTQGTTLGSGGTLILDSTMANRGDEIQCAAIVTDTSGDMISSSSAVTLGNREPSAPTVELSPNPAYIDSILTCTPTGSSDADGDSVSYTYAWMVNGNSLSDTGNTLSAVFAAQDIVVCTATPSDGLLTGAATQTSLTISNRAPTIDSLTLSPDPVYTDDNIVASVVSSDADGDIPSFTFSWSVNGVSVQSGSNDTLQSASFTKDDTISLSVTATDGIDTSTPETVTVTCANTPPTAPTIAISPTEPIEQLDDLTCSVTTDGSDIDGDALTYSFSWTVNGTAYTGATDTTNNSIISAVETTAGDEWICTAIPNDGSDDGSSSSSSVTIDSDWSGQLTFTTCGQNGYTGPSQSQCDSEYTGTYLDGGVTVVDGIQRWTVPSDGDYTIDVYGAQGGANESGYNSSGWSVKDGGYGAYMGGTFTLSAGNVLHILVGQQGEGYPDDYTATNGAGGGGTFVVLNGSPLIIAGGGGGAGGDTNYNPEYAHGTTSETGQTAPGHSTPGTGGSNGYGGAYGMSSSSQRVGGAGGGGFYGDGDWSQGYGNCQPHTGGGYAYTNGGEGGVWGCGSYQGDIREGGFGGGGATHQSCNGGAGGGGYSGGGGGEYNGNCSGGGGGGSYNIGTNQLSNSGQNEGHGYVIIDKL